MLRDGRSDRSIAAELHCAAETVARARAALGIPKTPRPSTTLAEKWGAHTRPLDGGHLEWTGRRQHGGTPVLVFRGRTYSAARVAYQVRTGRQPDGHVYAECGVEHCVAPEHVEDTAGRTRIREQMRYLAGGQQRPDRCVHGHDQGEHGRLTTDGRHYCQACKRNRKALAA
nr:hypothetical protein [Streptomyces sp. SID5468]